MIHINLNTLKSSFAYDIVRFTNDSIQVGHAVIRDNIPQANGPS
jgi:hypothetical protein